MASGRRRIRAGIALLVLGGVIATASCASFWCHGYFMISRTPDVMTASMGGGELSVQLQLAPAADEAPVWGWNADGSTSRASEFRWTIRRDPVTGRTLSSSHERYGGVVTPVAAIEHYFGSLSAMCWLMGAEERDLIARLEKTRVVRVTVASAFAPMGPLAIGGMMFVSGWSVRKRARLGACAGCGYDLAGVVARCPECGRERAGEAGKS